MGSGSGSGTGAGELIKLVVRNFDVLAGPMVTLVYPLYASIMEIENKSRSITGSNNDQQWLTYWILHSMITLFELSFANFIQWIPIWSYVKFFLVCWLVIPYFNGAALVYQLYLKPAFVNYQQGQSFDLTSRIPSWKNKTKGIFGIRKQDGNGDILTAVDKYIKENGTESLEKLIHSHRADRNMHYGDTCYTDYTGDCTENTYYGNMCYDDYNTDYTEGYMGNTYVGNMGYTDYNEGNTCSGDTYYRDYDYNEDSKYRPFVD